MSAIKRRTLIQNVIEHFFPRGIALPMTTMAKAELDWPPAKKVTPTNHLHGILGLILETLIVTICLSLAFASSPHHLRSSLWAAGAEHGWNSDPHERVYYYANYKTPPPVPFIWSEG
jgi:hypothetical protein